MAQRGGRQRDPAKERFWRRTMQRQQRSGLTIRDFCHGEGLKDWTFRWWRQELARRDRPIAAASERSEALKPTGAAPPVLFLPVRVVDPEGVSSPPSPPIEIVLPAGPTVRVPAGFDRRM